jgi:hypothetical protein
MDELRARSRGGAGVNGLRAELARVGIRGRLAQRIVLELDDHLSCDPAADLGAPREIAERFAEELRVPRTRRSAYGGFAALALAAISIGVSAGGGGLDISATRGWIVSLGGLGVVFGGQVAFVAGVLALWRALKRPQSSAELRLVQRRTGVALAAGGFALGAHAVQTVSVQPYMSTSWLALALSATIVPTFALGAAAHGLRGAVVLTPAAEPARRPFPWRLVIAIGAAAVTVMVVGSAFAEHSWVEGLSRGVLESIGFAFCFAIFGRRLGIRR